MTLARFSEGATRDDNVGIRGVWGQRYGGLTDHETPRSLPNVKRPQTLYIATQNKRTYHSHRPRTLSHTFESFELLSQVFVLFSILMDSN